MEHDKSLAIINKLEASIKKIEPNFKTPETATYFGRVSGGGF